LGAILVGPAKMPAIGLAVLLFQALLLAHGGLTTLGANLFSLSVAGPLVSWTTFSLCGKAGLPSEAGIFSGTALGNLATYAVTAAQLAFAYPDPHSGFSAAFVKFASIFALTQIPLAISEGLLTVVVAKALRRARFSIAEASS